jgi:hypothetical protein
MSDAPVLCSAMDVVGSVAAWHLGFAEPWPSPFLFSTLQLKKSSKLLHLLNKEVG